MIKKGDSRGATDLTNDTSQDGTGKSVVKKSTLDMNAGELDEVKSY